MISIRNIIYTLTYKIIIVSIIFIFSLSSIVPPQTVHAQSVLTLPTPGTMVPLSSSFNPAVLKGVQIFPNNPLKFNFIVDKGDAALSREELHAESNTLIKYFLASLTVPEDEMWVNLSPYEDHRIIPPSFGKTEMGRDLLAQDYILKQTMASLMYPEDELGQEFWDTVYARAFELYGTTDIPVNTFNKVWIVPQKARVFENGDRAFVKESYLKVMLDRDYLAMRQYDLEVRGQGAEVGSKGFRKDQLQTTDDLSLASEVIREILIPAIEHEVNFGANFAKLRQIYHAMILATWFKRNLHESILGQAYIDQNKTDGVDVQDRNVKEKIYQQYVESFRVGVYNFIREDYDPSTQEMIPRKYFSGGFDPEITGIYEGENFMEASDVRTWEEALKQNKNFEIVHAELDQVFQNKTNIETFSGASDDFMSPVNGDVEIFKKESDPIKSFSVLIDDIYWKENQPVTLKTNSRQGIIRNFVPIQHEGKIKKAVVVEFAGKVERIYLLSDINSLLDYEGKRTTNVSQEHKIQSDEKWPIGQKVNLEYHYPDEKESSVVVGRIVEKPRDLKTNKFLIKVRLYDGTTDITMSIEDAEKKLYPLAENDVVIRRNLLFQLLNQNPDGLTMRQLFTMLHEYDARAYAHIREDNLVKDIAADPYLYHHPHYLMLRSRWLLVNEYINSLPRFDKEEKRPFSSAIYVGYIAWAKEKGVTPVGERSFRSYIRQHLKGHQWEQVVRVQRYQSPFSLPNHSVLLFFKLLEFRRRVKLEQWGHVSATPKQIKALVALLDEYLGELERTVGRFKSRKKSVRAAILAFYMINAKRSTLIEEKETTAAIAARFNIAPHTLKKYVRFFHRWIEETKSSLRFKRLFQSSVEMIQIAYQEDSVEDSVEGDLDSTERNRTAKTRLVDMENEIALLEKYLAQKEFHDSKTPERTKNIILARLGAKMVDGDIVTIPIPTMAALAEQYAMHSSTVTREWGKYQKWKNQFNQTHDSFELCIELFLLKKYIESKEFTKFSNTIMRDVLFLTLGIDPNNLLFFAGKIRVNDIPERLQISIDKSTVNKRRREYQALKDEILAQASSAKSGFGVPLNYSEEKILIQEYVNLQGDGDVSEDIQESILIKFLGIISNELHLVVEDSAYKAIHDEFPKISQEQLKDIIFGYAHFWVQKWTEELTDGPREKTEEILAVDDATQESAVNLDEVSELGEVLPEETAEDPVATPAPEQEPLKPEASELIEEGGESKGVTLVDEIEDSEEKKLAKMKERVNRILDFVEADAEDSSLSNAIKIAILTYTFRINLQDLTVLGPVMADSAIKIALEKDGHNISSLDIRNVIQRYKAWNEKRKIDLIEAQQSTEAAEVEGVSDSTVDQPAEAEKLPVQEELSEMEKEHALELRFIEKFVRENQDDAVFPAVKEQIVVYGLRIDVNNLAIEGPKMTEVYISRKVSDDHDVKISDQQVMDIIAQYHAWRKGVDVDDLKEEQSEQQEPAIEKEAEASKKEKPAAKAETKESKPAQTKKGKKARKKTKAAKPEKKEFQLENIKRPIEFVPINNLGTWDVSGKKISATNHVIEFNDKNTASLPISFWRTLETVDIMLQITGFSDEGVSIELDHDSYAAQQVERDGDMEFNLDGVIHISFEGKKLILIHFKGNEVFETIFTDKGNKTEKNLSEQKKAVQKKGEEPSKKKQPVPKQEVEAPKETQAKQKKPKESKKTSVKKEKKPVVQEKVEVHDAVESTPLKEGDEKWEDVRKPIKSINVHKLSLWDDAGENASAIGNHLIEFNARNKKRLPIFFSRTSESDDFTLEITYFDDKGVSIALDHNNYATQALMSDKDPEFKLDNVINISVEGKGGLKFIHFVDAKGDKVVKTTIDKDGNLKEGVNLSKKSLLEEDDDDEYGDYFMSMNSEDSIASKDVVLQEDLFMSQKKSQGSGDGYGGINMDPRSLKIEREGSGARFSFADQQAVCDDDQEPCAQNNFQELPLMNLDNVTGFTPVIIQITPVTNLPMVLGLAVDPADNPDYPENKPQQEYLSYHARELELQV